MSAAAPVRHAGGCHCGRVRFEVDAAADLELLECNCSMCARSAFLHLIVSRDCFRLLSGEADLADYRFGTGAARHLFCRHCGVKSFYVPRSHPDGYSVNARCLDPGTVRSMTIRPFDGRDWERARKNLGPV
ncbi:MAG: GFA family protein [Steroidobacteraceae bacterium]|nr:GFA family protein [Steroidobacteraceae bacterium]